MPIRFFYSNAGILSKVLYSLMFWKIYSSSNDFNKTDQVFSKTFQTLGNNKIDLKNKIVLELGHGNSLISAYNFLLSGAKKVILVDKFPKNLNTKKTKRVLRWRN